LRYTLPVPIAIMVAAFTTIYLRFRRFDPVSVVERRLV
jgi:putative ABC transport system permease protein/lipoprotein-releasing system permease protein